MGPSEGVLPAGHGPNSPQIMRRIWPNNLNIVELLVERGTRLDIKDTLRHGTPPDWAKHCDRP